MIWFLLTLLGVMCIWAFLGMFLTIPLLSDIEKMSDREVRMAVFFCGPLVWLIAHIENNK